MSPIPATRTVLRCAVSRSSNPLAMAINRPNPSHFSPAYSSPAQYQHVRTFKFAPSEWIRNAIRNRTQVQKPETALERQAARKEAAAKGEASIFDSEPVQEAISVGRAAEKAQKVYDHHKYSTASFKISPRKLNLLSRQIAGKPIDQAIIQMEFSDKRASKRIKSTLCLARDHAMLKGIRRERMVVSESWVNKVDSLARVDIKGRSRAGIKHHRYSRLHVLLKEGATREEVLAKKRAKTLKRAVSAGVVREDVPIRNPRPMWAW